MKELTIFEVILENHPKGVARLEVHSGIIVNCNSVFAKSVGYSKEQLIGQSIDLFRDDILKRQIMEEAIKSNQIELEEQNQELRRVVEEDMSRYQAELDKQNQTLYYIKESLHNSELKLQTINDNISESVLFIDLERNIQFFNEIASTRTRIIFNKEIQVGSSVYEAILPKYKDTFDRNFLSALQGKRTISDVSFLVNNQDYWFEFLYAPVKNKNNEVIGVLLSARDINEKKIIESEIKKHMQELEILIQTKDKLFSIIANDLRNPFFGIIGLTEILEAKLKEEYKEDRYELLHPIQMMHTSSKSAYALLDNLIQWAKIKTGDIPFNPKNLLLKNVFSETIHYVSNNANRKNITIELDVRDNELVYADEYMVTSILRNILSNAIKFTHKNGKIQLTTQSKGETLEISVTDSGVGIDPSNLEKLFRIELKFSKLGTEREKGTGLGLILCKEFLAKLGGKICVESTLGKGSTFTFSLPQAK